MNKLLFKRACLAAAVCMLPVSQAALADVKISGWINEDMMYYDDGTNSDIVQASGNGTTLGSRITFSGSTDLPAGLNAGFEVILEPQDGFAGEPIFASQTTIKNNTPLVGGINTLGHSVYLSGAWGKVTAGLQTMPTDNIAVLGDPSLTLWSSIGVLFRGNGFVIKGNAAGQTWGTFLQCQTLGGAGIGLDCNGIYRNGVRYDLPTFIQGLTISTSYANDDIYDVAGTYATDLGRLKGNLRAGYAQNNGPGGTGTGFYSSTELFQIQGGLMDPVTGLFGTVAYQKEGATTASNLNSSESDVYWLKVGIKRTWNSLGDTVFAFQYGSYNDQYGAINTTLGLTAATAVTGSEVQRFGFEVDQYIGSALLIYGQYENLSLTVDANAAGTTAALEGNDLDLFTLGATYFF